MSARRRRTHVKGPALRDLAIPSVMVVIMLVMGIIFGSIAAQTLDPMEKNRLVQFLGRFSQSLLNGMPSAKASPEAAIIANLQKLGAVWVLAVTVIGAPFILAMMFLQGFATGFTVAILVSEWSIKGLLLALASVVPHNAFLVGGLGVSSAAGLTSRLDMRQVALVREVTSASKAVCVFDLPRSVRPLVVGGLVEAYLAAAVARLPLVF